MRFRVNTRRLAAFLPVMLVATLLIHSEALAQGCAMCSTAVNGPKDPLAKGLAYSIALMLAIPNVLVASIGGWLFYVYRRAAFRTASAGQPGSVAPALGGAVALPLAGRAPGSESETGGAEIGTPKPRP